MSQHWRLLIKELHQLRRLCALSRPQIVEKQRIGVRAYHRARARGERPAQRKPEPIVLPIAAARKPLPFDPPTDEELRTAQRLNLSWEEVRESRL